MTNYDRIKSMSVEEMAQELTKAEAEGYESAMPMIYSAWKQWLLQEVNTEITNKEKSTKAKWEINCDGYYPECTNCGEEPKDRKMLKICPNCGAEMENGEDER